MRSISGTSRMIPLMFSLLIAVQSRALTPEDITLNRNGVLLKGKIHAAEGEGVFPAVILLQGFPGNETDVIGIGEKMARAGINALIFNYRGTFQSQGSASAENDLKDISAAFEFLLKPENIHKYKIDTSRIFLGGWSHGGGMALAYAAGHPEVTAVFSIAGNDFGEFMRLYVSNPEIRKMIDESFAKMAGPGGEARFEKGATPKEMADVGIDKINPIFDLKKNAAVLAQKDILLIGGWNDALATVEQFMLPLYRSLQNEKAMRVRITAFQDGHYFRNTREEVAKTVIDWIRTAPERN
jgi:uncharacterized protein